MDITDDKTRLPVFALDIGTHSVIGVVGYSENGLFHIEAIEEQEHNKRSMQDGQIEDIEAVSVVAKSVKEKLESVVDRELTHVCVAAAGRALRTVEASFETQIPAGGPISKEMVYELEMGALTAASDKLKQENDGEGLFCVGHSVVRYYVDNYAYSTIVDHKGKKAKVDIIATFLPEEVVSSLEITMQKADMNIEFITLEPIAAMNAVIPAELRLLNLALVDIGAGTTDIAICSEGTVAAYTMVTVAGDEITETLIKQYLIDFETAEKVKFAISQNDKEIEFSDIMGVSYTLPTTELLKGLAPSLEEFAQIICDKIIDINVKSPAAVFLVGGGGRTPLLCKLISEKLDLDERKVAIGGGNFMKRLIDNISDKYGPEYATPLGIAITAASEGRYKGFDVYVNGEEKHLIRTGKLSMMDVLLLCGYNYIDVMGRSGKNLLFELNGEKRILRGGVMQPAGLLLNGEQASISSAVYSKDSIHITPAKPGIDARLTVKNLAENKSSFYVTFCGEEIAAGSVVYVNGEVGTPAREIKNADKVKLEKIYTFYNLCTYMGKESCEGYLLNGVPAADDTPLQEGDIISAFAVPVSDKKNTEKPEFFKLEPAQEPIKRRPVFGAQSSAQAQESSDDFVPKSDRPKAPLEPVFPSRSFRISSQAKTQEVQATVIESEPQASLIGETGKDTPVAVADEPQASFIAETEKAAPVAVVGEPIFSPEPLLQSEEDFKELTVTLNNGKITLPPREGGAPYLFLDMLSIANIDPSKPQGDIELLLNGHEASFLEKVQNGDTVSIIWKDR